MNNQEKSEKILQELVQLLDIPPSYYQKAVDRYRSMAEHFERPQSEVRDLDPDVHPQGSFRLGTVIRPLSSDEGYDLDLVCRLDVDKRSFSQKQLKELVGREVKSYSEKQGFAQPPTEGKRCWTQEYQDDVDFHMDVLPSIPVGERYRRRLAEAGVDEDLFQKGINITDKTEPNYANISPDWPTSNPRGFALWFERCMDEGGMATRARKEALGRFGTSYASAEDVPAYELKTPLQRSVQLLKRHRDQMFRNDPDGKPISIIITTLAARAYDGESDLAAALGGILERMGNFVSSQEPRVVNPVDPQEDFADRWNTMLEGNFWRWLRQAQEDFGALDNATTAGELILASKAALDVQPSNETAAALVAGNVGAPAVVGITKVADTAPRSWGMR